MGEQMTLPGVPPSGKAVRTFPWPGGKARLQRWVRSHLPEAAPVYCEPFAGALSVLLNRDRCPREQANDLDPDVANWWIAARDNHAELIEQMENMPQTYESWDAARAEVKAGFTGGGRGGPPCGAWPGWTASARRCGRTSRTGPRAAAGSGR